MIVEERVIHDIPILLGFEKRDAPQPLVVLAHGFTRSKEDWRGHFPDLVRCGYSAAALDNRGHGERGGPDFTARTLQNDKWDLLEIRKLIDETAEDIRFVVEEMIRQGYADPARIGAAGVSMGAFASLKALVMDGRIRTAVSIIGSPYWDDVFEGTLEEDDPAKRRRLQAFAERRQPASFPDRFFPRAVLFQTGEKDPHLRSRRVKDFCDQLGGEYRPAPERIFCREYPGIGHEFTSGMWNNALRWFERFL
jgi:pimeloyl-ACP methyl ester carboxylesterase